MPTPRDRGFFDKVNNAFFVIVDFVFDFLEKRGWNVPLETRFFFHGLIFIALFYFASSILLQWFYAIEALLILLIMVTFYVANIRPIRQFLGYYTSDEKIHSIVNKIANNQISINSVVEHLNKNLLPPHLTLSIIHAYQKGKESLPPQLIKSFLRQPPSLEIIEEIIKNDLNDTHFSVLMRHYKNMLNKETLLKVIKSQKLSGSKIKDTLFFQESAYKAIKEIAASTTNNSLIDMLVLEKQAYRNSPLMKNFLRQHHLFLAVALPLLISAVFTIPVYIAYGLLSIVVGLIAFILLFEYFYAYLIQSIYFKV